MRTALVTLFNQDFSRCIPRLESLYRDRFDERHYIVPSHWSRMHRYYVHDRAPQRAVHAADRLFNGLRRVSGRRNPQALDEASEAAMAGRICRVTGNQFFFYHYWLQAAARLQALPVDWFLIVADDAILHPALNQDSWFSRLGLDAGSDAFLCRPVLGSDDWLARISGSVGIAERRVARAFGECPAFDPTRYPLPPDTGTRENRHVAVSCADVIAVRRDLFARLLPWWRRCFAEKIYVEMAVPNAVLRAASSPVLSSRFVWERIDSQHGWRDLFARMLREDAAFCHPVKLSLLGDADVAWLSGAGA